MTRRVAFAPGRVNLMGDHTDYTGGWVLPMALQLGTTVAFDVGGSAVHLSSDACDSPAVVPLDVEDPSRASPPWARYVAGVVASVRPADGGRGRVSTTLPVAAGLSSSAALEVAVALSLGFEGSPLELALLCQGAEQRASGVPCGLMDQLASAAGVAGHCLLIDCSSKAVTPVRIPDGVEVVAVHSGEARQLAGSAYAQRRADCEAAAAVVGPLRDATPGCLARIVDGRARRRARHVLSENGRVLAFADALRHGDLVLAGRLMAESHLSLRDDFEVSTPALDALVARLQATRGVWGARLTGAGFGGCAVALSEPGALSEGWRLVPSAGACLIM